MKITFPQKTCASLSCPERRSVCCNAKSKAYSADEGTGYFKCATCGGEFIGGKCTAGEKKCGCACHIIKTLV